MGFADSRGDKSYNKELSAKRAEAVKNYLEANGSTTAFRLSVEQWAKPCPWHRMQLPQDARKIAG